MKHVKPIALTALSVCLLFVLQVWSQGHTAARTSKPQGATVHSLVGTWTLVSETAHHGDETTQPLGPNPQGLMMFDSAGRFMMIIARPDIPKFAVNKRDAGTPEENKAVLAGMLGFFGTYSMNGADQVLIIRPEAGTFPNWNGADQKRFLTFEGDQMIWTNRTPAIGAEVTANERLLSPIKSYSTRALQLLANAHSRPPPAVQPVVVLLVDPVRDAPVVTSVTVKPLFPTQAAPPLP